MKVSITTMLELGFYNM